MSSNRIKHKPGSVRKCPVMDTQKKNSSRGTVTFKNISADTFVLGYEQGIKLESDSKNFPIVNRWSDLVDPYHFILILTEQ